MISIEDLIWILLYTTESISEAVNSNETQHYQLKHTQHIYHMCKGNSHSYKYVASNAHESIYTVCQ